MTSKLAKFLKSGDVISVAVFPDYIIPAVVAGVVQTDGLVFVRFTDNKELWTFDRDEMIMVLETK